MSENTESVVNSTDNQEIVQTSEIKTYNLRLTYRDSRGVQIFSGYVGPEGSAHRFALTIIRPACSEKAILESFSLYDQIYQKDIPTGEIPTTLGTVDSLAGAKSLLSLKINPKEKSYAVTGDEKYMKYYDEVAKAYDIITLD